MSTGRRRAAAAGECLAGLAATGLLLVGLPAALWSLAGWPLPRTMPAPAALLRALSDRHIPDEAVVNALAVVGWLCWTVLVLSLLVETAAALRGLPARLAVGGPLQTLAARLVAAVALLGVLADPEAAAAHTPTAAVSPTVGEGADTAGCPPSAAEEAQGEHRLPSHLVRRYDTLWSLADRRLGDPFRWREIWRLNQHRRFDDGRAFTDPDRIHPGWTLRLPADAGLPPDEPPADVHAVPPPPPVPDAGETRPSAPSAAETATATVPSPAPPNAAHERPRARAPLPPAAAAPDAPSPAEDSGAAAPDADGDERDDDEPAVPLTPLVELPSGAAVGLTLAAGVAAALALARLHRRRRYGSPADAAVHSGQAVLTDTVARLCRADSQRNGPPPPGGRPRPSPRHPSEAAVVTIGERDGRPIPLDLSALGGLCLTGPAARHVARAVAVDFLARHDPVLTEIVIAGDALADELLPTRPPLPSLDVRADLDAALTRLEVERLQRARLIDEGDEDDFDAFTRRHPAQPMPALLLIAADPQPTHRARLHAVLSDGPRLGISGLILGPHPDWPTVTVDDAGRVQSVEPDTAAAQIAGARLCTLTRADADELLAVLAAGHDPHPEASAEPEAPATTLAAAGGPEPATEPDRRRAPQPLPEQPETEGPPITVRLLGAPVIRVRGRPVRAGLRGTARELLAYLLVHADGAAVEEASAALWPEHEPRLAGSQFRAALSNLNRTLREDAGLPEDACVVQRTARRCRADPALIACDLWDFERALAEADTAADPSDAAAALERATRLYHGDLLDGEACEWAAPARDSLRRRALDALTQLADLHQRRGHAAAALQALEQAIRHEPHAEPLYHRIMRLQAALGRPDAIRRTYRLLQIRLAELDAAPDPHTKALAQQLLNQPASPR